MIDTLCARTTLESRDDLATPEPGSLWAGALVGTRMDEESARGDNEGAEEIWKTDDLCGDEMDILVRKDANRDVVRLTLEGSCLLVGDSKPVQVCTTSVCLCTKECIAPAVDGAPHDRAEYRVGRRGRSSHRVMQIDCCL